MDVRTDPGREGVAVLTEPACHRVRAPRDSETGPKQCDVEQDHVRLRLLLRRTTRRDSPDLAKRYTEISDVHSGRHPKTQSAPELRASGPGTAFTPAPEC